MASEIDELDDLIDDFLETHHYVGAPSRSRATSVHDDWEVVPSEPAPDDDAG